MASLLFFVFNMSMITVVALSCDSEVEASLDALWTPWPVVSGKISKLEGEREAMTIAEALALNGHRVPTTPTNFPDVGPYAHQQVGNCVEPEREPPCTRKRNEDWKWWKSVERADSAQKKKHDACERLLNTLHLSLLRW